MLSAYCLCKNAVMQEGTEQNVRRKVPGTLFFFKLLASDLIPNAIRIHPQPLTLLNLYCQGSRLQPFFERVRVKNVHGHTFFWFGFQTKVKDHFLNQRR